MKTMKTSNGTPTPRMVLGRKGEDLACRFLTEKGHTILERNYRTGHLEIDVITLDGNGVHFVEVKCRVAPVAAAPEENVTATKQKRLAEAALRFLHKSKDSRIPVDTEVSFDVVAVTFDGGKETLEWFPNAFIPVYV